MNAPIAADLLAIGTAMTGGFFAGAIMVNGQRRAVISAPKRLAEFKDVWHPDCPEVMGTRSYFDGMANTRAMAEAGSESAKRVLALEIDGFKDFYIPAQDELELCYRAFKPTMDANWLYARSGINVSALPPSYPYTADFPAQTALDAFKAGGEEAFEELWYWTSTQRAASRHYAWCQNFGYGHQYYYLKSSEFFVRAVRSQPI